MRRTGPFITALLLAPFVPLAGQDAIFVGVVTDSLTGNPVGGASVSVREQGIAALTDEQGRFELEGVGKGVLTVLVRRAGYRPGAVRFEFTAARRVRVDLGSIALSPLATELRAVVVEDEEANERLRKVGFYQRMRSETGTFITQDEITQRNPALTSELLRRIAGFRVLTDGSVASARGIPGIHQGFSLCGVDYYIDGVHASPPDVDIVIPTSIGGIEVYTGPATIPLAFRVSGNAKCGVVVIWTRDGGRRP